VKSYGEKYSAQDTVNIGKTMLNNRVEQTA